uniref:YicC family protein n=1 Tax=Magnetococcus massalia (strain MO-1) TaxID=451514 RepID=A0A1S7LLR7_MAGMO|nr:Conserved protein of unknown function [Candidatus Magnetococcus massalia]
MAASMTGMARSEGSADGITLAWRLRSVNQRYFEVSFRLPEFFLDDEIAYKKILQGHFARGSLEAVLSMQVDKRDSRTLTLNSDQLQQLLSLEKQLVQQLPGDRREPLSHQQLLAWSGVVEEKQQLWDEAQQKQIRERATELLQEACAGLAQFRAREGASLKGIILDRLTDLEALSDRVEARLPAVREALKVKIDNRIQELTDQPVEPQRLAQEFAFLLNKMDITEELDRLRIHIQEMRSTIENGEPIGRRLDFLCQEVNRESNTLCSKPQDTEISRIGVDMKVTVEKIREQVQNLE